MNHMHTGTTTGLRLAGLLALALASPAQAQAPEAPPAEPGKQMFRIEPTRIAGIDNGKGSVIRGTTGSEGHHFFLENLNMAVPVSVTLMSGNPGDVVQLDITKRPWEPALRTAKTGDEARYVNERLRTQGEFQIAVTAPEPDTMYQLVVWVGDELKPELRDVVVAKSEYEGSGGGFPFKWAIAALLLGIFALLAVLAFRRKRT